MKIKIKRMYDPVEPDDGFRVLVDRVWPRGITKAQAQTQLWLREIAPSTELRKWFAHDPEKFEEFKKRYFKELDSKPDLVNQLLDIINQGPVTLLYSAKNREYNQAMVLKEYLLKKLK